MNADNLMNSLEFIDDSLLETAADSMRKRKRPLPWKSLTALAACLALVAGLFAFNHFYVPPVPVFENAIFSAEEVASLFSASNKLGTNTYETVGYPNASFFDEPLPPQADYLNVYRMNGKAPNQQELEALIARVYPKLEKMYGTAVPEGKIEEDNSYSPYYGYNYTTESAFGDWIVQGSSGWKSLSVRWFNRAFTPLMINGMTLQAHTLQTDEQILKTISPVIPYLEETFEMELSAHKIAKSFSSSDGSLQSLQVYLYDKEHISEQLLAQYSDSDRLSLYCSGDMLCLEFSALNYNSLDTVECRSVRYIASLQHRLETYAQCRMITLREAEAMLANGYVFSNHACKLCMAAQDKVDFAHYDRVSLEYVFEPYSVSSYGIPFYTFYKQIKTNEDGSIVYAKTMVPAIEVSGLEEYFAEQEKQHDLY